MTMIMMMALADIGVWVFQRNIHHVVAFNATQNVNAAVKQQQFGIGKR